MGAVINNMQNGEINPGFENRIQQRLDEQEAKFDAHEKRIEAKLKYQDDYTRNNEEMMKNLMQSQQKMFEAMQLNQQKTNATLQNQQRMFEDMQANQKTTNETMQLIQMQILQIPRSPQSQFSQTGLCLIDHCCNVIFWFRHLIS